MLWTLGPGSGLAQQPESREKRALNERMRGNAEAEDQIRREQGGNQRAANRALNHQPVSANLVTRAGARLIGVQFGSTSIADVNADGHKDLLITGRDANYNKFATLYLGVGDGSFSKADVGLTGVSSGSSSIADVDGNGHQDLLITGKDTANHKTATLYSGVMHGSFSKANVGLAGVEVSSSSIADVDGNGHQDLLITGLKKNNDRTTTLYLGTGDGSFSKANVSLTGVSSGSSSIADVDGNGHQDLLITGEDARYTSLATLYLGTGGGSFSKANAGLTNVENSSSSIADVDADGHQDLLITGEGPIGDETATLYLGTGDGSFSKANAGLTGVGDGSSSIADVDGDGHQDLLITGDDANQDPTATLYLGTGDGSFSKANAGLTGVDFGSSSIADVDGDGHQDLLITGEDAGENSTAILYLGSGDGSFSKASAD